MDLTQCTYVKSWLLFSSSCLGCWDTIACLNILSIALRLMNEFIRFWVMCPILGFFFINSGGDMMCLIAPTIKLFQTCWTIYRLISNSSILKLWAWTFIKSTRSYIDNHVRYLTNKNHPRHFKQQCKEGLHTLFINKG